MMDRAPQCPDIPFSTTVSPRAGGLVEHFALPCALIRGGTSKGVFIRDEHLPSGRRERDRVLLALMGSPDPRQIDGLGGADPLTSKVAVVSRSQRDNVDVEYESLEVGIAEARVNHGLMCGNLIAGVAHFALAEGLVRPQVPLTTIRIFCRSNRKMIVATVPVADDYDPLLPVPGGVDPEVGLLFFNPAGAISGRLLPAGEARSRIALDDGRTFEVSIVDAGTLYAFIAAEHLGVDGQETPEMLDANSGLRSTVELLRQAVADHLSCRGATALPARLVKVAIVAPPGPHRGDSDIAATVINPARVHKAYAVSGGICLAAASVIEGSVVNRIHAPQGSPFQIRIGHPSGTLDLAMSWSANDEVQIQVAEIRRSARFILRGTAFVSSPLQTRSTRAWTEIPAAAVDTAEA